MNLNKIVAAVVISAALCASLTAQVSTAEVAGVVSDVTGAVVANAKVTLTNKATGISRDTTTDQLGNYIFTLIQPGDYNLSVEAPGFKKVVQSDINLQVGQRARIDLAMQVGQVSETVEVAATAPLLESQSSSLGNVIGEKFVSELPLNGRNFVQLAILYPGRQRHRLLGRRHHHERHAPRRPPPRHRDLLQRQSRKLEQLPL